MAWRRPRVVLGVVVAVALLLVLVDVRGSGPGATLRGVAGAIAGPPESAMAWVRTQATDRFGGAAADRARIEELEQQLAAAQAQAGAAASEQTSSRELRVLAAQAPAAGYAPRPGRVVSVSARQDPVRSAAVSTGSGRGVESGFAVLGRGGLAGVVASVSPGLATVRLVVDPTTEIAARVASSGEIGVVRGTGSAATFEPLDPLAPLTTGALIVTLGVSGGQVPSGLPIGMVARVTGSAAALTRAGQLSPAVDDSTLDQVLVLVPESSAGATP